MESSDMTPYIVKDLFHYCNISVDRCLPMPSKKIPYYDLTFVLKGSMTYIANGTPLLLCENDAILLPPETLRQRKEGEQRVQYVSFNFSLNPERELALPLFSKNVITQDIRILLDVFSQRHLSQKYHSEEKLCNLLNYILYEILDAVSLQTNRTEILKIEKFIEENITQKITLGMIGNHMHLSREYVSYIFKKHVGKTVIEFVNERKMMLAKSIIRSGELSMQDVAKNLGFENYGYFSRTFQKHFHISPIDFKKSCRIG